MTGVEEAAPIVAGAAGGGTAAAGLSAAEWAALAASIGGTAASMYGTQQQANQRKDILDKQLLQTQAAEDKTGQLVDKEGSNYQADARQAALTGQQGATLAQSQADLGPAPTIIDGAGDSGAVSSDYLAAKADKALSEGTRLTALATALSKTRGVGQLETTEGLRRADLAGTLQDLWSTTKDNSMAAQDEAANVAEPWWGQAGQLAAAAGTAYGASGAGRAAVAAPSSTYSLAGTGANLATTPQPSFWNTTGQIRFGR